MVELIEAHPDEPLDQLDAPPTAQKADSPKARRNQVSQKLCRLREHRSAGHRPLVDHRRVPDRDPALGARCSIGVDQPKGLTDEALGQLKRIRDRRRGEHEARGGAVAGRDPAQPAKDVGDVRSEHAPIGVGLVDDDPAEAGEEFAPALVVGQDSDVEHVGVREHQVRAPTKRRSILAGRVAVVDRLPKRREAKLRELARLVLGERLGRVEVKRATRGVATQVVEDGEVEAKRLA